VTGTRIALDPETERRVQELADELREIDDNARWKQVSDPLSPATQRAIDELTRALVDADVHQEDADYIVTRFRIERTAILYCVEQEQTDEARAMRLARRRRLLS
jgi:hypothetical protein